MKQKLISLLLTLLSVVSLTSLAACGKTENGKAAVYLLARKDEAAPFLNELAEKYKSEKGVEIKVVTSDTDSYDNTLKTEMAKTTAPSMFFLNGTAGYNAWKSYCKDLKDTKLYSSLTDKSLAVKEDDGVYAIPYDIEGYGIIYNKEITDKYFALKDRKTKFNSMDEVNSFEKLKELAEDMTANKEKLGIKGVFASTSFAKGEDKRWHTQLLNLPLYYEAAKEAPDDSPVNYVLSAKELTSEYADNFRDLFDLYIKNSVSTPEIIDTKTEADSVKEFALSEAAMMQNDTDSWEKIKGVDGNTVKPENVKLMPIYIGAEGESGQGICIGSEKYVAVNKNASAEEQKAAVDFAEWLFTSETGKKYVTEKFGYTVPFDNYPETDEKTDPLGKELNRFLSDSSVKNVAFVYGDHISDAFTDSMSMLLVDYAKGKKIWDDVKKDVADKWKDMMNK